MKKCLILFSLVIILASCTKDDETSITGSLIIQNDRLTFSYGIFGNFTVSTDYEVQAISSDGENISITGTLSSGGERGTFLQNQQLQPGSTLKIFANGTEIYSETMNESFNYTYHDDANTDWIE